MGIAAPRIGIARAAAVVHSRGNTPAIILLNPQITTRTDELDEQYEGCLSFRCVRRFVPRPLQITVETATPTGETVATVNERAWPAGSPTPHPRSAHPWPFRRIASPRQAPNVICQPYWKN
ncbi:peptide deformylase [Streptomyces sp. NPDC057579]|uniref:peptide deformylase n=1 Tax=Streptomyces sp. NPDC057579 TaxID=3346172 RepID=UPI003678565B